jgi:hypothetical protein
VISSIVKRYTGRSSVTTGRGRRKLVEVDPVSLVVLDGSVEPESGGDAIYRSFKP